MENRRCNVCQEQKKLEDFYHDKTKTLGRDYTCIECRKILNRARDRERDKTPERVEKSKNWVQSERGKERARQRRIQNFTIRKERRQAQTAIRRLIKMGIIIRQPCEICGNEPSKGHHPDYSKPIEVVWLCQKHHSEVHRK